MPRKRKYADNQADLIALAENEVRWAERRQERSVALPTVLARVILELAKRALHPHSGTSPISGRQKIQDKLRVGLARSLKAKLLAEGRPETGTTVGEAVDTFTCGTEGWEPPGVFEQIELLASRATTAEKAKVIRAQAESIRASIRAKGKLTPKAAGDYAARIVEQLSRLSKEGLLDKMSRTGKKKKKKLQTGTN
jgi:hypothetical protein